MKKIVSFLLTPVFYLFFYGTLLIFHPIQAISLYLFGYQAHKKVVDIMNFFLKAVPHVTGASYKFVNFKKIEQKQPVIFICNHQSMWDIPPLIWMLRNNHPKFVAKKSLTKGIPSISFNLKRGGSVNIDRKKPDEAILKIKEFAKYLHDNNRSVIIFPEGTRTQDGKVSPFKIKGVEAILNEIPEALVVPIAINGTYKFDKKRSYIKNAGVKMHFEMLPERKIKPGELKTELLKIQNEIEAVLEKDERKV